MSNFLRAAMLELDLEDELGLRLRQLTGIERSFFFLLVIN